MPTHLGIDLAWAQRGRTGLAVVDATGRLLASTSVRTDDEIATFLAPHLTRDTVVAIDAPLIVPNATGSRPCEKELGAVFRPYDAGAHPANTSHPWFDPPRGATLADCFGWDLDPRTVPFSGTPVAIEVYPHPAMVSLFGLGRILPYKNKRGRTLESLRCAVVELLDHVDRVLGPTLGLATSDRWAEIRAAVPAATRKVDLRIVEDEIDAILCAHLAWLWGRRDPHMEVFGDVEGGYIVTPGRPTVPPAHRLPQPTRPGRTTVAPGGSRPSGQERVRFRQQLGMPMHVPWGQSVRGSTGGGADVARERAPAASTTGCARAGSAVTASSGSCPAS